MDTNINNWYEKLVYARLKEHAGNAPELDEDAWSDIACITLNHLPPRYVRHTVDMTFYTPPQERDEMDQRIDAAILEAIHHVRKHPEEPG